MTELVDFLLARIAADEARARAASQVPEGIQRVVERPQSPGPGWRAYEADGRESLVRVPAEDGDSTARPLGSWGWNGGPHDDDDPEWRKFAAALDIDPGSGIRMDPYHVIDSGGWDEDEPIGAAYRVAEIPARCSGVAQHIARWDPLRVLAECEAKRRIVEMHGFREDHYTPDELRALALPYADDPDFREEWRP